MKILFAASEGAPFVKSGGLGDVIGALPPELSKYSDVEVAVVLPMYSEIKNKEEYEMEFVTSFHMPLAWRECYVGVYKTVIKKRGAGRRKGTQVTYYFIDNESYFCRGRLYGEGDDGERFAYFSKALLESIKYIDFIPDIISCNDWQCGFVPLFLKAEYSHLEEYKNIKTVFTIHNIEYQGKAYGDFLGDVLGLLEEWRSVCEWDGMINAMKCAIVLCDKLTTVSKTYADEISYSYFAHGLESIIAENKYKTCGIVNGIDTDVYSSSKDKNLPQNFTATNHKGKEECKKALQRELSLPEIDVPVFSMVTRLVSHKGLELVECVAHTLATMGIQLVILGTGDGHFEEFFKHLQNTYPDTVSANIAFSGPLASRIYAGSDFFLMPSKSEPCGLSQLIAMRYGTIPVVRETGGLYDTVPALDTESLEGRGFTFKNFNAHEMLDAVERSAKFYEDKEKLKKLRTKLMREDFSWQNSAEQYIALYKELIN